MAIKVALVSLGCAKNLVDAERILYTLYKEGFEILSDVAGAEVIIVNTCAFIDSAKQEAIDTILEYAELKKEGRLKGIVVTGCMAQQYAAELEKEIPEVDCIVSPGFNKDIGSYVTRAAEGKKATAVCEPEKLVLTGERITSTPEGWAYLKIADGCDNRCSYCMIPYIRGAFRSVPIEALVAEAKELVEGGAKELILIAQDTTRYGADIYGEQSLPRLIRALEPIEGLEWIRIMYMYPDRIDDALIDCMAGSKKVVPYIDLPLQHADAQVLSAMNRRGDPQSLLALLEKLRSRIENLTLRTTVMVGFPGEGKEQFERLLDFVKAARFDRLGCFVFSPQEGTPAAALPAACTERVAKRRERVIMNEAAAIMAEKNAAKVGQTFKTLVEGFDRYAECWFGRTAADAPEVDGKVFFKGKGIAVGQFVNLKITEVIDYDMVGEIV